MLIGPGTSQLSTRLLDARFTPVLTSRLVGVGLGTPALADGRAEVASSGPRGLRSVAQKRTVTAFATMLIAACSSGKAAAPSRSASPSLSPTPDVATAVLAAWRAEHLAYANALRALNANDPALAQTAVNPALQRAVAFIATAKAQGIVVRGTQDLGTPTVVELSPTTTPDTAIVRSCIHDGLVLINGKTGKPVPGTAGEVTYALEHTTLKLVEGVGWMVSDNDIEQGLKESVCAAS